MTNMTIITHRGLEPSNKKFYPESSFAAFDDHLSRGFGIEFDVAFTKDDKPLVTHDTNLGRISGGESEELIKDLTLQTVQSKVLNDLSPPMFDDTLQLIIDKGQSISALHLKGIYQSTRYLDLLITLLTEFSEVLPKILIFDVTLETAKYLKEKMPSIALAPSVAHEYDIKRYNECVHGTLCSVDEVVQNKELFEWVWLDEWDLSDEGGRSKKFNTKEVFQTLKDIGLKISLVTPELHAYSPGLLGGESHPDAANQESLFGRIEEIVDLGPDAVCTDYPEEVSRKIAGE